MGVLEELEQAAGEVAGKVAGTVVRIGRGAGRGAGVVVSPGVVATNAHNLRGPETTVTFADGRTEAGRVAGVDLDGDLAVVVVDTGTTAPVEWSERPVGLGSPVFAVTTSAAGSTRVSFGLVSSVGQAFRGPRGRRITGSVEHTAPLSRGSSGGPVVDGSGRLVGINTNRLGDGFYLALPADADLRARIEALARGEAPARRSLGVAVAPPHAARELRRAVGLPERAGLLVREVQDGSPAARAGVRRGDLVVAAAGRSVVDADDLYDVLDSAEDVDGPPSLDLTVVRGTDEVEVRVAFADGPRDEGSA